MVLHTSENLEINKKTPYIDSMQVSMKNRKSNRLIRMFCTQLEQTRLRN